MEPYHFILKSFTGEKSFKVETDLVFMLDFISVKFTVKGDVSRLRIPAKSSKPGRRDELWKHTCFELFVLPNGQRKYIEINASPSGDWALYGFDDYRVGSRTLTAANEPEILTMHQRDALIIQIDLQDIWPAGMKLADNFLCGISCVLEDVEGGLSYWAVHHKSQKPDFHLPDNFVLVGQ